MGMDDKKSKLPTKNYQRKKTDYAWIALIYFVLITGGEYFFKRSSPQDVQSFYDLMDTMTVRLLNVGEGFRYVLFWLLVTSKLFIITTAMWYMMKYIQPSIPTVALYEQAKQTGINFFLLAGMQTLWEFFMNMGLTRVTMGHISPLELIRDSFLWMFVFELSWYTQHRLMHDVKFFWKYGHRYHHQWNKKEHMIGITNFAFDHVVEVWVTMSSAFFPIVIFPSNYYLYRLLGMSYMILAVLVHWDFFPLRYHLNHHYMVVKNYGSHWSLFDRMFGTYAA